LDGLVFEDCGRLVLFGVERDESETVAIGVIEEFDSNGNGIVLRKGSCDVVFGRSFWNSADKRRIALLDRPRWPNKKFAIIDLEWRNGASRSIETVGAGKLNEPETARYALGTIKARDDADVLHGTVLRKCTTEVLARRRKIDVPNENSVLNLLAVGHSSRGRPNRQTGYVIKNDPMWKAGCLGGENMVWRWISKGLAEFKKEKWIGPMWKVMETYVS
jgi:hypothetical protein